MLTALRLFMVFFLQSALEENLVHNITCSTCICGTVALFHIRMQQTRGSESESFARSPGFQTMMSILQSYINYIYIYIYVHDPGERETYVHPHCVQTNILIFVWPGIGRNDFQGDWFSFRTSLKSFTHTKTTNVTLPISRLHAYRL